MKGFASFPKSKTIHNCNSSKTTFCRGLSFPEVGTPRIFYRAKMVTFIFQDEEVFEDY